MNEGDKGSKTGWHFVELFVKSSNSKFFNLKSPASADIKDN